MRPHLLSIIGTALILMCLSYDAGAAPQRQKSGRRGRAVTEKLNIRNVVDSVDWLRERYCDMLAYAPTRTANTMKDLQRNFSKLPANERDSLLAAHYSGIVRLFQEERSARAYAFADCYYGLAPSDDPNLGPLYLNDIVLSIEQDDSIKLRQRITQLRDYAQLNNLDYDTDLAEAEDNMRLLRHRVKFRQTPVSEFAGDDLWMLDSRLVGSDDEFHQPIPSDFIAYVPVFVSLATRDGGKAAVLAMKIDSPKKSKNKTGYRMKQLEPYSYGHECDTITKTMYCVWGHERTRSANPRLIGMGRQLVQETHATVSGELAKKKYSYGKKLMGEVITTIVDAGLNALFDWMSVTTEYFYRCELSLTLVKPSVLEGVLAVEATEVKSNQLDRPKTKRATIPVRYLRMLPKYDYCFMYNNKPICSAFIYAQDYERLVEDFKRELPAFKERYKSVVKKYKAEHPDSKEKFDMHDIYNLGMLDRLRELGEQSIFTHPKTQP